MSELILASQGLARVSASILEPGVIGVHFAIVSSEGPSLEIQFGHCPLQMNIEDESEDGAQPENVLSLQGTYELMSAVKGLNVSACNVILLLQLEFYT